MAALRSAVAGSEIESAWRIVSATSGLVGAASILHFLLLLSRADKDKGLRLGALVPIYAPVIAIFVFLLAIGFFDGKAGASVISSGSIVVLAYYGTALVAACWILFRWNRRTRKPREKKQSGIILTALVPSIAILAAYDTLIPGFLARLSPELATVYERLYLFPVIPLAWSAAMWYAITRYRLLALSPDLAVNEIMENILDLLVLVDGDGNILDVNSQVETMLTRSRSALVRRPFVDLVDEKEELAKVLGDISGGLHPSHRGEATYITSSRERIPVRLAVAAVKDQVREVIGLVVAAQDIRQEKQFEALSKTDRLTGLHNRFRIDEVLEYEFLRSRRTGETFSVGIAEIDHFKCVNDEFGHPVGDEILRMFARELASGIRSSDTLGRWGGEEFFLILPGTKLAHAAALADKLRASVQATDFRIGRQVTTSFGIATLEAEERLDDLVSRADAALYEAKKAGRNRVCAKER